MTRPSANAGKFLSLTRQANLRWISWGWTDLQDAARACRLAIEKDWRGHEVFFINGDETKLSIPTLEAIVRVYPGVPLRKPLDGFASVLDTSKAERIMGWVHETQWVRKG